MHSIHCDLPYPSLSGIKEDYSTARILSSAYAGQHSELGAILQYVYHHYFFKDGFPEIAELLEGIAVAEMHHLDILGETLRLLGVAPIYSAVPPEKCRFFNTANLSYATDYQKMLLDDIQGELIAIREYREMLYKLKNQQVQAIIERIVLDEELHVEKLKSALDTVIAKLDRTPCVPEKTE